jgi:hypothetical protein
MARRYCISNCKATIIVAYWLEASGENVCAATVADDGWMEARAVWVLEWRGSLPGLY